MTSQDMIQSPSRSLDPFARVLSFENMTIIVGYLSPSELLKVDSDFLVMNVHPSRIRETKNGAHRSRWTTGSLYRLRSSCILQIHPKLLFIRRKNVDSYNPDIKPMSRFVRVNYHNTKSSSTTTSIEFFETGTGILLVLLHCRKRQLSTEERKSKRSEKEPG